MADPLRHRQTKGAATDMVDLTPPRHIPTLPSAVLRKRSVLGGSKASASGAGSEGPTDPVAQGLPHDEVEVAALEPRQLLGEQGHALPPGARHPGDVGAPEHPLGTEGVETALQMRMQAAERVFVVGVAC